MGVSEKIKHHDFLRRHYPHQVKGSKFDYFLSACFTSSPVFVCWVYYIPADQFAQLTIRTKMKLGFVGIAQLQFPTPRVTIGIRRI